MPTLPQISSTAVVLGCDPEFFLKNEFGPVGSEDILPQDGLVVGASKVVIDGLQAELNPAPNTCRQRLCGQISASFFAMRSHLEKYAGVSIDFRQTIKLSQEELDMLSDNSKKFGCMPSKNAYLDGQEGSITVNPDTYEYRSAGGHIHLGRFVNDDLGADTPINRVFNAPERLARALDIILGNTCVLIDRDPSNAERRKVYGRAGEFRTPKHGFEYRTLSNFWLRCYPLAGFVFGLARQAFRVVANNLDEEFLNRVDLADIEKAINKNDYNLALNNFEKIIGVLLQVTPVNSSYPIHAGNIDRFRHFVNKGLDYWFPGNPVDYWTDQNLWYNGGFETFLDTVVARDMMKK